MTEDLPRIGAEIAGYRLLSLVTRGGMAVVYLAEDLRLGRKVALKILAAELAEDDDFRTRFLRESKTAASIDHPNVIPIYDAGEAEGHLYIAMRHVDDIDLKALLKVEPELEIARATSIASQIAGALGAAHKRDLVHRDVKPANVLIIRRTTAGSFDHIYLSDFGLAKHTKSVSGLTATGHFMGTVNYAAPEQVEGKQVDGRTDIYALGCVLFECLTGRPPFHKEEGVAVIMAHLREPPPSVRDLRPDCPPALAQVVAKTLAKSPDERYQTCEDLIAALQLAAPASGMTEISATAAAVDAPAEPPEDALTEAPPVARPGDDEPKRRSIPGGLRAALALGLVAIAALAVVLLAGGGDDGDDGASGATASVASTTATGTESDLAWEALPDTPTPRQQAAGAVVDGKAWIVGGLEGEEAATATDRVESYDAKTQTWEQGPELPVALHHAVARNYHGELVVIGGWTPEGEDLTANTSGRVFVLRGASWEELPELNHPRAASAAAVVGGELVVVGGQADGQLVPEIEVFDGEKWTDAAPMPTPREHLAAASDGTYLYTVGGRELSSSENSGALERYDPAKDEWTSLPPMPNPIGSFDATIAQGRLITVGGELPTDVSGEVQAYELKTQTWSTLPSLATPRHGLTVVVDGSKLYAVDGALEPGHAGSTTAAESLDLATAFSEGPSAGRWRELTSLPTPRQQAAGAIFGGRIWQLGGLVGTEAAEATATTATYDPAISSWTAGPDLPQPLHHATAATYDGELVVIGGWTPEGADLTATTSGEVLALRGEAWEELPPLNHPRTAAAAAAVGDKLIVIGGQADGQLVPETEVFDGETWTDAAPLPNPREHLAAVTDGTYLYAVGGRELAADQNSAAFERYDPATDEWTTLPEMPVPSGSLGAAIAGGELVAAGGEDAAAPIDAVQAYDLEAGTWAELPPLPTPRHGLGVFGIGNTLYALGGALAVGHADSADTAEALDFD